MGRFRVSKAWKKRNNFQSYNVDYPFFDFLNLKIRRAFKMRLTHWGFAVRGAAFFYKFLKVKKTKLYSLNFSYGALFSSPLENVSTTFKYPLNLPEVFNNFSPLLLYNNEDDFEYLEDEFRSDIYLTYDQKWVEYRFWWFNNYLLDESLEVTNELFLFIIFYLNLNFFFLTLYITF